MSSIDIPGPAGANQRAVPDLATLRDTIIHSQTFARCVTRKAILDKIFEREIKGLDPWTDADIGQQFYGDRPALDQQSNARVAIRSLNDLLNRFFDGEGRVQPTKVAIGLRRFTDRDRLSERYLSLAPNNPSSRNWVELLWEPYYESKNRIVYADLLFFRHDTTYIRDILFNDVRDAQRINLIEDDKDAWTPSYHFTSAGEMAAMMRLIEVLVFGTAEAGKPKKKRSFTAEFVKARDMPAATDGRYGTNLIGIGNGRSNGLVARLQENEHFILEDDGVRAGSDYYQDEVQTVGPAFKKYAVLTRRSTRDGFCVTLVGGNYARSTQGLMNFLTTKSDLETIFGNTNWFGDLRVRGTLPAHFQVLFEVVIGKDNFQADILACTPIGVHFP